MNLFTMLREKEDQEGHDLRRSDLIARIARDFEPKEDITAYELALIFKIFTMLSNDMNIEEIREKARNLNVDKHFDQIHR